MAKPHTRADGSALGMGIIDALVIDSANLRDPSIELKAADHHMTLGIRPLNWKRLMTI